MKLLSKTVEPILYLSFISILFALTGAFIYKKFKSVDSSISNLSNQVKEVTQVNDSFKSNLEEELFKDHLAILEGKKFKEELAILKAKTVTNESNTELSQIDKIYKLYTDFTAKVQRNQKASLKDPLPDSSTWGTKLIGKDLETLTVEIEQANSTLDDAYKKYVDSLPKSSPSSEGYSYVTANTERGSFGVNLLKFPLSSVRIKTVAAIEGDCSNNCPTKSLADYVNENGAYAGMNGSYFCPPDYPACEDKVNSFDYAFYDSNDGTWFNEGALSWFDTGLMTFSGGSYDYYEETSSYGGSGVDAGISNYPSLVAGGNVAVNEDLLTSYQSDVKGNRGVIGASDSYVYLAIVRNATVTDAAYAIRALGATNALNLDGGGSSAMFVNGGYVAGPGRSLPNAILVIR